MAEKSYLWTTGGAGDGATTYTRADWARIAKVLAACNGAEGIGSDYLNALAGSVGGANTVNINTGGAVVDGKPYDNDASVGVNIPSASGGGNTRIDRIVLRADWTAQTVRITRIAGTDAASPTAPAITQSSGTTYDIKICQALVTTGGAVTLTDERDFAQSGANSLKNLAVTTAKINDEAVTTAKLAADSVDDTKAGNRVPQFYRRQGGSSSVWSTVGSSTQTPGAVRMQGGARTLSAGPTTITFPVAFSQAPLVICQVVQGATGFTVITNNITASSFDATVASQADVAVAGTIHWLAIGPE